MSLFQREKQVSSGESVLLRKNNHNDEMMRNFNFSLPSYREEDFPMLQLDPITLKLVDTFINGFVIKF